MIERTFLHGHVRSVIRSSDIPASLCARGFDLQGAANGLVEFVNSGRRPAERSAAIFLG